MPELDRRDFLKLVGVGAGAAAATGCSDPVENLIPYVIQPEEITPGISVDYASTCMECPVSCGLHVTTREGRPIKLEGNPEHPINRGRLCTAGQVSLGRAYHPDRYDGPMKKGGAGLEPTPWEDALADVSAKVRAAGSGTRILGGPVGPTLSTLFGEFNDAVRAGGRTVYDPFSDVSIREASGWVFGRKVTPLFDLADADLVLDFSSDFLDQGLSPVENATQFAAAKDVEKHPDGGAVLVSVGPRMSMSASKADEWVPSTPGGEGAVALALAAEVFKKKGSVQGDAAAVGRALQGVDAKSLARSAGVDAPRFDALVDRVLHAHSAVALPPGVSVRSSQATSDAAAVLLLNAVLGATGKHVHVPSQETAERGAPLTEIEKLVADMNAGRVSVLLIHDSNPVYSLPAGLGFAEALEKVGTVVSFASMKDETSQAADYVLPDNANMESWGDAAPREGVLSLVQPTLRPLKDTRLLGDTLIALAGGSLGEGTFLDRLKTAWMGSDWRLALSRGGDFQEVPAPPAPVTAGVSRISIKTPKLAGSGEFTLVAYPHSFIGDGRGAAQPWLQEIPDPIARASWLSWLEISNASAERLGVAYGDVVSVETDSGSIEVPVYTRGGIGDDVVALAIGQGHTVGLYASQAGDGRPGVARGASVIAVLPAARDESGGQAWLATKASVRATGGYQRIPLTQFTDNQRGRELAPTISLLAIAKGEGKLDHGSPDAKGGHEVPVPGDAHGGETGGSHEAEDHAIVADYEVRQDAAPDSPYRWAMSIDNDKCTACGACVAACYVENNIPVIGEEGTAKHREMSWIRIERYVGEGDRDGGEARRPHPDGEIYGKTDVRYAAMLCQQCGAAPCESVCPVIATYHSPEGLNAMIYNRCVGTRYCANNCVYKVRRFNYFDYSRYNWPGNLPLMANPDVTVRQQGVMEKCTFCVQRIATARQTAKDEGRIIGKDEVVTACQQTCPSDAIEFGNSRDPQSFVAKAPENERSYHSLQVLNTRPAITYLSQVQRVDDDERSHG